MVLPFLEGCTGFGCCCVWTGRWPGVSHPPYRELRQLGGHLLSKWRELMLLLTLWVLKPLKWIVRRWWDYWWFIASPYGAQYKLPPCKLLRQPNLHVLVLHFMTFVVGESMEQSFPPPENFFCHHETWLSCHYFLPKESRLCREARFAWCAQGLPSRLMLLGGGAPSIFPGVCEIQSVLEEPNLWLNEKYLRYCLPHSNHRANEGLHHVAMKLVMAFKCSGVSIHPCSSLTM